MGLIKNVLTICLLVSATVSAQAYERTKSCLESCSSKKDFPYYADTALGLDYGYDIAINKRVLRGDVDIKYSLVVDGVEEELKPSDYYDIDYRHTLIFIRMISGRWDINGQKTADFNKKIELKLSMVSGGRVLDAKIIPFTADNIADQILVDEPREIAFKSEVDDSSAKVVVELIASGDGK
ncbi:hypothetical protein [Bdellovibrio sp. HCB2-146]|uniref:hypothetical protein n=1 Tax=Bdellovibrio sp. HCB2-146 TaxID=3394362 RepID=UPI0039BD0F48